MQDCWRLELATAAETDATQLTDDATTDYILYWSKITYCTLRGELSATKLRDWLETWPLTANQKKPVKG